MNSKQVLALDGLNKGLRAKTPDSAYYVGVIGALVYTGAELPNMGYYPYLETETWANQPRAEVYRLVAIRGDYPKAWHGLLLRNEYQGMVSALKTYIPLSNYEATKRGLSFAVRIDFGGASVMSWYCGKSARRACTVHALHENLSWLARPERANAVHTLDPRVVSYGWFSRSELPSCFKSKE